MPVQICPPAYSGISGFRRVAAEKTPRLLQSPLAFRYVRRIGILTAQVPLRTRVRPFRGLSLHDGWFSEALVIATGEWNDNCKRIISDAAASMARRPRRADGRLRRLVDANSVFHDHC